MFDNLREQANLSPLYVDEAKFQSVEGTNPASCASSRFLGMSPVQRFIISVILMIMVCTIGAMFLLVTGRIGLF